MDIYKLVGQFEEAEKLQKIMSWLQHEIPWEVYSTTDDMIRLANIYSQQGQKDKAKAVLKRPLVLKEQEFGEKDSRMTCIMDSVGAPYGEIGDFEESRKLLLKSMELSKVPGYSDDHGTMLTLFSISCTLCACSRFKEAEECMERALSLGRGIFGDKLPAPVQLQVENLIEAHLLLQDDLKGLFLSYRRLLMRAESKVRRSRRKVGLKQVEMHLLGLGSLSQKRLILKRHLIKSTYIKIIY